jgi:succinoglycan biosynthesis protein ExoO
VKPRPIVSVIIAAFNAEEYIVTAVSSALSQTMTQLEVIVVDDGSTDATVSRIQSIHDERVRLYTLASNQGPSFCRNYAIERAQGDWIAILDSDDWWDPTRLDVLLGCAIQNQAHVVCDDLYLVKDETSTPQNTYLKSRETVIGRVHELTTISPLMMIHDDYGVLQPLIQADFLRKNSIGYKDSHRFGEDFVLLLDCLMAGAKMMLYPVPYYYYRYGHASASASAENPIGQCTLLGELLSSPPYNRMPQIRNALQEKLTRKRLVVEEARVKQLFKQKQVWDGITTVLQHPRLLVGYARSVKRKVMNSW